MARGRVSEGVSRRWKGLSAQGFGEAIVFDGCWIEEEVFESRCWKRNKDLVGFEVLLADEEYERNEMRRL